MRKRGQERVGAMTQERHGDNAKKPSSSQSSASAKSNSTSAFTKGLYSDADARLRMVSALLRHDSYHRSMRTFLMRDYVSTPANENMNEVLDLFCQFSSALRPGNVLVVAGSHGSGKSANLASWATSRQRKRTEGELILPALCWML